MKREKIMLRSIREIIGSYKLLAIDGEIGKVTDFFFDDMFWHIKYIVADTGDWLNERLVLLSPRALVRPDWTSERLPVDLTKEKIENSPPIDKHKPVSKQNESDIISYYAWPAVFAHGVDSSQFVEVQLIDERQKKIEKDEQNIDIEEMTAATRLRSTQEIIGYGIQASDGVIGHVEDFIFEDLSWIIRYIVIDTGNWLSGKKVLVSPEWIKRISWANREVYVDMKKEWIKNSPEFDPSRPINRTYEVQLYDFYGRPKYWK
jgi:hypothetical protein